MRLSKTADWGLFAEDVSVDSWRKNVDSQLNATAFCCIRVANHMKKKGATLSTCDDLWRCRRKFDLYEGTKVVAGLPIIYSVVKGGIVNLSRYLASYYGRYNIRVNTVCPGGVLDRQDPQFVLRNMPNKHL